MGGNLTNTVSPLFHAFPPLRLQVLRVHADVCQGLEHLATLVSALPAPEGVPPLMAPGSLSDPEQVLEVLAQCEGRLLAGYK